MKEYKYKMIISSAVIPDVGRSMSDSMPVCEYSRGYAEYIRQEESGIISKQGVGRERSMVLVGLRQPG